MKRFVEGLLLAAVVWGLFWLYPRAAAAAFVVYIIAKIWGVIRRHRKIYGYNEHQIDDMDGHTFEQFCAELLYRNGFRNVEVTSGSGDHGVDVLAMKDGFSYAIQCKHYEGKVGNKAVQEVYTGKDIYQTDRAAVICTGAYSPQAIEEAKELDVELWDRETVIHMMRKAR